MEEPKRLPILREVKEILIRNSGVRCAFHNCTKLIIDENNRLKGEICHIEAAMPGGERFNAQMTNEERRSINNLILLCFDHHEETNNEEVYTVGVLQEMKKAHEKNVSISLNLIDSLAVISNTEAIPKAEIHPERVRKAMELLKRQEQFLEIERRDYREPPDYIKRSVYYLKDIATGSWESQKYDLIDLVKIKKHLTILGVAGSGKSVELEYLAYFYSVNKKELFPIKIRLNSFNRNDGIEELLALEFADFSAYKNQKLLIILDALDEVAPEYLNEAVRQIETLQLKLPNSSIVVSCRNNFYSVEINGQSARINGFDTYSLNPLTRGDIEEYCNRQLGTIAADFFEHLSKKKFSDQLKSPFYLVNLVDFYKEFRVLPTSRSEIFEFLLKQRIQVDNKEKYRNHGLYLEQHQDHIQLEIKRLAISAEYLQRNYLEDKEFRAVVPDYNLQKLIEYTFLFDKNKNGSWEFQHNNFQEYLAAKYLADAPYKQIKRFIAFGPEYNKIKPTWLNTVSLLFGIIPTHERKFKRLLKWVISSDIDLVIHFEKENIDIKKRELIFKKIYKNYEKKKILIRSEKFDSNELGEFISDSRNIAELLIGKARKLKEAWKKAEALRILPNLEVIHAYTEEIESLILSLLGDVNISDDFKLSFLYTLRDLDIYSDELTEKILNVIDIESSQYLRAGLYAYLSGSENGNLYTEIIINGIGFINEPKVYINASDDDQKETRLSDEKYNLERLIEKFQSIELTRRLLKWGLNSDEHRYDQFHIEIIEKTLRNAKVLTKDYPRLYDDVLSLLISLARRYSRELSKEFNDYFSATGTSLQAFVELRKQSKDLQSTSGVDYYYAIAAVVDKSCVASLLKEFEKGELSHDQALRFRNLLGGNNRELHDYYLYEINKLSDNAFAYVQRDFEQERRDKLQNDIELLLNKDDFKNEINGVFEKANVESFRWDDLWEFSKEFLNDDQAKNNIVLSSLRKEAKDFGMVTKSSLDKILESEEGWFWFQIHKILEIDKNNEDFEFDEKAKIWLRNWLMEALKEADYSTAIFVNEHNEIRYRYLEHYIPYISFRADFELDEETYLDFLWLAPKTIPQKVKKRSNINLNIDEDVEFELIPSNLNEYVIDKTTLEKSTERIIENLNSGSLFDFNQKYNHCKFCAKYGVNQGIELIKELIQDSKHEYEKRYLIEWYLALSKDLRFIEDLIDSFDEETRFRALELLLKSESSIAAEYCVKKAKSISETERKFRYINILSKSNYNIAFDLYKNWIITNKVIPDDVFTRSIPKSENVNDYFEIFEDAINNDYGNSTWSNRNQFIDVLIDLGTKNENDFKTVKKRFEVWIKKYDLKFLFYQIQRLELEYYSNISQEISIDEVLDVLSKNEQDVISILNGFIELKPNILGIGFNLNKLIEYFIKGK